MVTEYKYLGILFKNTEILKCASGNLDRARKAYYSLKSKIPESDTFSVKTWLKLYKSMILPILTYGSEVWLADYNLNFDKLDRLPFEKTQNMIFKNILGVHNKASNFALYTELGSYTVCFMSLLLMFRYYRRLLKIESENKEVNSLLRSAFIDKSLQKSWNKIMLNMKQKMNISSLDISNTEFSIQVRHFFEN